MDIFLSTRSRGHTDSYDLGGEVFDDDRSSADGGPGADPDARIDDRPDSQECTVPELSAAR